MLVSCHVARPSHEREVTGASEDKSRERTLTQPHPAKVRKNTDAVVLKQGGVFLVTTDGGDIPVDLPHGFGLFFNDCRFLDGYDLTLNGVPPVVLSGGSTRGYQTYHHLSNPEMRGRPGRSGIERNTITVQRRRIIRAGVIHERQVVTNYGATSVSLSLEFRFRSSFQDLFVVKGFVRKSRGALRTPKVVGDREVHLAYAGTDGVVRVTRLTFSPAPTRLQERRARFTLRLGPGRSETIAVRIQASERSTTDDGPAHHDVGKPSAGLDRWAAHSESIWLDRSTKVRSDNPLFDRVFRRALLDLHLLRSRLGGLDYFAAGVPWYVTLFGRDSSTVTLQTLPYGSAIARSTIQLLARYQATKDDPYRDASPGKILHELRRGELANVAAIPQSPAYYGTVDATMLFLILVAEYVDWSGDLVFVEGLRAHIDAALGWMEDSADSDGYFSYRGQYRNGLVNQGWKDSGNAIQNADGSLAEPPIALCEVQAYAYRAWRQSARLLRRLEDPGAARKVEQRAEALRERFARDFWDEGLGGYVLARQRHGRPAAVMASNTGQVLWGGLATPAHAARIAGRLMEPDMFSGWGIRTLSAQAPGYNPMGYHLGSVWPHDNSLILAGLRRYGHDGPALKLFDALFDAATNLRDYRLPELYCGYAREESAHRPVAYPVACNPQAWASGSLPYALWSLLGLRADARDHVLTLKRPRLPAWLHTLELQGLPLGRARLDLKFERPPGRHDGPVNVQASTEKAEGRVQCTEDLGDPHEFE
jgi:glycogen debranching enzyme